jgi:hypothetical protein
MGRRSPRPAYPPAGAVPLPVLTPARRLAVRLMLLGALLQIMAAVVFVQTGNAMAAFFAKAPPGNGSIHAQIVMQDQVQAPFYAAAAVVWLILAAANRRAPDARIGAAIAFAGCTLLLRHLFHPMPYAPPNSAGTVVAGLLIWLVGLAVMVLLYGGDQPLVQRLFRLGQVPQGGGDDAIARA